MAPPVLMREAGNHLPMAAPEEYRQVQVAPEALAAAAAATGIT